MILLRLSLSIEVDWWICRKDKDEEGGSSRRTMIRDMDMVKEEDVDDMLVNDLIEDYNGSASMGITC